MSLVSVIILTRNEEIHLPHCVESLRGLDCDLFVVDSGSTDRTVEIAKENGATVVCHDFVNYAAQLNWALTSLEIRTDWVMRLDADEILTPELVEELNRTLPRRASDVGGLEVKRRVYFMGRWIKHGSYYPTWLLRVWRNGNAHCEQRWMDEHMILGSGRVEQLRHDLSDYNRKGLSFWIDKHNGYADREVMDLLSRDEELEVRISNRQASRRRFLKTSVYARMPLFLRAFLYWAYRYFLRFGFLDGREGLIFHFLQAFWYRFLVDAKLYEKRHSGK